MKKPLILAITGASGVIYGVEMLRVLRELDEPVHLIMSKSARLNLSIETDFKLEEVREMATMEHSNKNLGASISSGSFLTRGMIIAPCTIKTLSAVANSYNDTLIVRTADVCLKEHRKLVLMVRETPLHGGHLDLMARAASYGAVILPPVPSFYHQPGSIMDIIHQTIGKILDQFEIEHDLFTRWGSEEENKNN